EQHTVTIDSRKDFYDFFTPQNAERPEIHGGFALAHWNGKTDVEAKIKEDLGVTIRCIPLDGEAEAGRCIITGEPSARRVVFAKSY
ncbi:MAG: proline--tRNA ligase, partial [Calditrichaeota bacterium]|nr:proline--tRNA ligase [Calditrichota bacterium]